MAYCKNCGFDIGETTFCARCGAPKGAGSRFCPSCGEATDPIMKFCVACGHKLEEHQPDNEADTPPAEPVRAVQPEDSGVPFEQNTEKNDMPPPPVYGAPFQNGDVPPGYGMNYQQGYGPRPVFKKFRNRLTAGLLGIFLGFFGVHRFYLGYTAIAVVQLLLSVCSCGFLFPAVWIWGLIEGILIICKTGITKDGEGKPLQD